MATIFGFTVSSTLLRIIYVIITFLATIVAHKIILGLTNKYLKKTNRKVKIDDTQFVVLRRLMSVLIYIIGIAVAISFIPSLRTVAVSLFAGAGVLAVVIGFAAQQAFSNIISGIFIAIYKPFRVGDIINFSNRTGVVEDINLRHTVIRNFENKRFIAPNSIISNEIVENYNIDEEKTCRHIEFGISYDSDIDKAMKIMAEEIESHSLSIDNRTKKDIEDGLPKTLVKVIGFGDSSVNIRAWAWAKNPSDAFMLGWDVNKSIKERFDKEGVEIPFPYRTIVYKKDT